MHPTDLTREHPDALADGAPPFELDRERIVHAAAFRRLEYKTQVFVALEGDHYRTRLTHTLEVAHLARCLARALALDAELAEVVALAHDLGHPPFGHAGERALNDCLADAGGFEHNAHSLRVVELLEHPYAQFRGLNLTRIVRECLAKHTTRYDQPGRHPLQDGAPPPLEGQLAALADRLAYGLHDLQDALYAGLIEPGELHELTLWRSAGGTAIAPESWRAELRAVIDRMQQWLVRDAVSATRAQLPAGAGPRTCRAAVVALAPPSEVALAELEAFLLSRVYRHQRLVRMDSKARRVVQAIFAAYVQEPALMPRRYAQRVPVQTVTRVAADYVAGMTDRYCLREHARLFDPQIEP